MWVRSRCRRWYRGMRDAGSRWRSRSWCFRCGWVGDVRVTQADPLPINGDTAHLVATFSTVGALKAAMLSSTEGVSNQTCRLCSNAVGHIRWAEVLRSLVAFRTAKVPVFAIQSHPHFICQALRCTIFAAARIVCLCLPCDSRCAGTIALHG